MNATLPQTTQTINTLDVPAILTDCLTAAANAHEAFTASSPNWTLTLADMEQVYLQTWGREYGIDLTAQFPTIDQFNAALLDDPDYADFLAQCASGVPMF